MKQSLKGLSKVGRFLAENGYFSTDYVSQCPSCLNYFDNDEFNRIKIDDEDRYVCNNCLPKIREQFIDKMDEESIKLKAFQDLKKYFKENNIQQNNRKCPDCGELIYSRITNEKRNQPSCYNPKCGVDIVCYYFERCGNVEIADYENYGETWGDKYSGEPQEVSLCKECWDNCKCEYNDNGKITKRDKNCVRHSKRVTTHSNVKMV